MVKCKIIYKRIPTRRNEYGEYVLKAYKNGKRYPNADYFTDDKEDAIGTFKHMMKGCE